MATHEQASPPMPDVYKGAQYDLVLRCAGAITIVGVVMSLALTPFYPPSVAIGAAGWALVLLTSFVSIVLGASNFALRRRPSPTAIHASSYIGIFQVAALQWLAGGGKAPYIQLLMLPMIGAGAGEPVRRCAKVVIIASLAAFTPLLYSSIDVLSTVTEFTLLSAMTIMVAVVISSTREHRARLQDAGEHADLLAHVDPLTGMPNRRAFDEMLEYVSETSQRDGTSIALLLCDVNSFKQVNDTFGHAAGDQVLQSIAHALNDAVRKPDTAFRWAGDEFAVILRDTDEVGATRVGTRIRDAVAQQCRRPDGSGVSIATGVAALKAGMSTEEVLVEADRALFRQKERRSHMRGAA